MAESDPTKTLSHLKWSAWNGIYDAIAGYYGAKKVEELIENSKAWLTKPTIYSTMYLIRQIIPIE